MRREKIRRPRPAPLKRGPLVLLGDGVVLCLVLSTAYLVDGSYNPFLYFRF